VDDRTHLICLKLSDADAIDISIVEAPARAGSPFEPAIYRIPADLLYPRDRWPVQALHAENGDIIEGLATVLESKVWRTTVCAERVSASAATISTTPPRFGVVISVADDVSGPGFSHPGALPVWAAETFHCSWTVSNRELIARD
jgi:hypothetical protein